MTDSTTGSAQNNLADNILDPPTDLQLNTGAPAGQPQTAQPQHSLPVALAWASIREFLARGSRPISSSPGVSAILKLAAMPTHLWHSEYQHLSNTRAGAFVSLHCNCGREGSHELRGCIGTISGVQANAIGEILHNAVSAASEDPRFPAVTAEELDSLQINVDILSPSELVANLDSLGGINALSSPDGSSALDAQRFGVIVSSGWLRGLLLPALEGVNTPYEQVAIALRKAGISSQESFRLERFEVVRYE